MFTRHFRQAGMGVALCVFSVTLALGPDSAQGQEAPSTVTLQGYVRDSTGRPLANATVVLEPAGTQALAASAPSTHTDSAGAYRFTALRDGAYTLRAEMSGYAAATVGPVNLAPKETKNIDLALVSIKASEPQSAAPEKTKAKPAAAVPEFFDEPQFTVAGVTQATNPGGHGSDTVLRTTEALARATVSLSNDNDKNNDNKNNNDRQSSASSNIPVSVAEESSLRDAVARNPKDPALHHQLGDVEEKLGDSLAAVREYQRAAELDPSEPDLFDWGTELLTHRALEPATEVFAQGNRLFPKSVRMLVALGVAWYARGSYDQASQCLVNASDLAPDNPTPYLFLGRMQSVEATPLAGSAERLARFARLQPDNALANYYYAVSLRKQSANGAANGAANWANDGPGAEPASREESLLQKAVHLDPKLSEAYLQLGILYAQRADFSQAISNYQQAIKVGAEGVIPVSALPIDETLEEAHYRLAQAYLRVGDKARAQEQLQLHDQISRKIKEDTERQRREIQGFVISLRSNPAAQ